MTPERFDEARAFYTCHSDKAWSFTNCVSFVVMQSPGLTAALTIGRHIAQAGFQVLLKP